MKVETNVGKIERTGFGREDGGCLGAPFLKLGLSRRQKKGLARLSDSNVTLKCLNLTDWL